MKSEREFDMGKLHRRRTARGYMRWCEPRVCWDGESLEDRYEMFEDGTRGWGQYISDIADMYFYFDDKDELVTPLQKDQHLVRSTSYSQYQ